MPRATNAPNSVDTDNHGYTLYFLATMPPLSFQTFFAEVNPSEALVGHLVDWHPTCTGYSRCSTDDLCKQGRRGCRARPASPPEFSLLIER